MKKIVLIILALFLSFMNTSVSNAAGVITKDLKLTASDGFTIKGTLTYPKVKTQRDFPTVVLLHSLGYNSEWWGDLPQLLSDKGYAVLKVDLRGHGQSVFNNKLAKVSWKSLTNNAFAKYPSDLISVFDFIKEDNPKRTFFNNYAIVGADIGASTGVIAADKYPDKPKTIVLISPVVKTRSLDIPVSIAQLDDVDFLSITGADDTTSKMAEQYLKKFAQKEFSIYDSASKTTGMIMLKNDPDLNRLITEWIGQYLSK